MVEIVPENLFVQVHRSSIINFREIEKLSVKDKKVIVNGHEIGIGRNYKKDLIERLKII